MSKTDGIIQNQNHFWNLEDSADVSGLIVMIQVGHCTISVHVPNAIELHIEVYMERVMGIPKILTAIPQRRYRLGDYGAVVLGEIESGDNNKYRYILALVREGESAPSLYVTTEKNPRARAHEGSHRMRVVTDGLDEDMGSADRWCDLDVFCEEALAMAAKVLGLADESPVPLF